MVNKNYYNEMTKLIYQDLAWGPIYKKNDGAYIKDTDNKSEIYISLIYFHKYHIKFRT